MRYILILFLILLDTYLSAQSLVIRPILTQAEMSRVHSIQLDMGRVLRNRDILVYRLGSHVKLSMKSSINLGIARRIDMSNPLGPRDYLSLSSYDMRGKIYINWRF